MLCLLPFIHSFIRSFFRSFVYSYTHALARLICFSALYKSTFIYKKKALLPGLSSSSFSPSSLSNCCCCCCHSGGQTGGQQVVSQCPSGWVGWQTFCYLFVNTSRVTWSQAKSECEDRQGHMLRVETDDEYVRCFCRRSFSSSIRSSHNNHHSGFSHCYALSVCSHYRRS